MDEIIKWYYNNVNIPITKVIIDTMLKKGIISSINKDEINDLLLDKQNGEFITNKDGKFTIKESRVTYLSLIKETVVKQPINTVKRHFKLRVDKGNKFKLINLK